jgi:CRP-like cAMP-binding protein
MGVAMETTGTTELSYTRNQLLQALPESERQRLLAGATQQDLKIRHVLFEPREDVRTINFPLRGVISLVTVMRDGSMVEMATIGREGVVGVPMVLDRGSMANAQAVSQVDAESISITTETFLDEFWRGGVLASLVQSYVQALFTLVGQNAACNSLHSIHQRCARWLLMTGDRVGEDQFHLTHEFLSQMLGSRRASVTDAAGALQGLGAIRYRRGAVEILDREQLEASACECYAISQEVFDRLYERSATEPVPG